LAISSTSRSFNSKDSENWQAKLAEVHRIAWNTWQRELPMKGLYKLPAAEQQKPGVISDRIFRSLEDDVAALPPKNKYHKVKK